MRTIDSGLQTRIAATDVAPFMCIDLDFDTAPVYLWTGVGTITIDGKDYLGAGDLLQISDVEETAEVSAVGMNVTLSGIPSAMLAIALTEQYQGRAFRMYFGAMPSWDAPETSPVVTKMFNGYIDEMPILEGAETCTITVTVESRLVELQIPRVLRYTSAYQKAKFPGDKAFDFLNDLVDKPVSWGGPEPAAPVTRQQRRANRNPGVHGL